MDADTVAIQRILAREFEQIVLRRKLLIKTKQNHPHSNSILPGDKAGDDARRQARACNNYTGDKGDVRYLPDTVGLCLSGGGLPAVAFASGALHALAKGGYLQLVDYISCAEEGALTAACLLSHLFPKQVDPSPMGNPTHDVDGAVDGGHWLAGALVIDVPPGRGSDGAAAAGIGGSSVRSMSASYPNRKPSTLCPGEPRALHQGPFT